MSTSLIKISESAPHKFKVNGNTNIFEGAKEVTFYDGNLELFFVGSNITFSYTLPGSPGIKQKEVRIINYGTCLKKGCTIDVEELKTGGRRKRKTKKTRRNRRRSSRRRN